MSPQPQYGTITALSKIRSRHTTLYDNRGRVYRTKQYAVDPATGAVGNALTGDNWYDAVGHLLKAVAPGGGGAYTRHEYDTVGRRIRTLTACDDGGEQVVERQESVLDSADDVLYTANSMRDTDASTLSTSYQATWYDGAGRPIARGNYGVLPSFTRPGTPPARSDIVLVETYAYDAAGQVYATLDPKGLESRTVFDDAGRVTARIENYLESPSESDDTANRTTRTAYNPDGNVESVTLKMNTLADDQTTIYAYGVTLATSDLASGLLVRSVQYGDSSGEGDRIVFAYNRQSQVTSRKDQAGTIHAYAYDALGRGTADRVTALGAGVDDGVRRIDTAYEVRGMVARLTCYSDLDASTVVNQVGFVYNAFRQLVTDRQEHLGAINAATLAVNYAFADGSANQVRMTAMTYPNGREIDYGYGVADGLDDLLSRLEAIRENDADVATFKYLGLGTVVRTDYPAPGVRYDLWGGVPGAYTGFDRFLRVADLRWYRYGGSSSSSAALSSSSSGAPYDGNIVHIRHGYDRNSNRLYRENPVAASYGSPQDQLYAYDNLNRLTDMQRGTLNAAHTALTQKAFEQAWGLDKAGNWSAFDQDDQGNGAWDLEQTRATNNGNEIVDIGASVGPVWATPTYDAPGNMVSFPKPGVPTENFGAVYDAWNRLVTVLDGEEVVAKYAYDGRSFRVTKTLDGQAWHYFYNSSWQLLEERLATPTPADLRRQYVWGIGINSLVLRDGDTDNDGFLNERLYALQDSHWDMCAVVGEAGSVVERYEYEPYGKPRFLDPAFGERSGSVCAWEVLFQGSAVDDETGLYHIRNRYDHPVLGLWVSRGPLGTARAARNHLGLLSYPMPSNDTSGVTAASAVAEDVPDTGSQGGDGAYHRCPYDRFEVHPIEWSLYPYRLVSMVCGGHAGCASLRPKIEGTCVCCGDLGWCIQWRFEISPLIYLTEKDDQSVRFFPNYNSALAHEQCHVMDKRERLFDVFKKRDRLCYKGPLAKRWCEIRAKWLARRYKKMFDKSEPANPHEEKKYKEGGECYSYALPGDIVQAGPATPSL